MGYSASSPYHTSKIVNGKFLDVMINRPIPGDGGDYYWTIEPAYNHRPDLLASHLYDDSKLWWVFAQRNPNTLKDPLGDFTTGTQIYIPNVDTLKATLGL
jgi:hypothetical protein